MEGSSILICIVFAAEWFLLSGLYTPPFEMHSSREPYKEVLVSGIHGSIDLLGRAVDGECWAMIGNASSLVTPSASSKRVDEARTLMQSIRKMPPKRTGNCRVF